MKEDNALMILFFLLCGEKFGLKVSDILEVNRTPEIMPLHGTNENLVGLINFHGKCAPVLALDRLLTLNSTDTGRELFIALKTKNEPLCFLVDELTGFKTITDKDKKNYDDIHYKSDSEHLSFVYIKSGSMIPVLDANFLTEKGLRNKDKLLPLV
ncbi:MAG: chemotaxis protein CheW [Deltaproteobacteria bacterium]|nr:chemotaxis protein CheW [Deltaproteobacteria bacterium]